MKPWQRGTNPAVSPVVELAKLTHTPREAWAALWVRTALTGAAILAAVFGGYELFEHAFLQGASYRTLHVLHILRGSGSAILLSTWAFLRIRRERLRAELLAQRTMAELEARVAERTQALKEAQAFTELLFDSLREQVYVLDPSGTVIKANRAAREAKETTHPTESPSTDTGTVWEIETVPVRDLGPDLPRLALEVRRDVTAQRSLEAQVRHQEKMASLGLMAAGFAHDLGNPLASLSSELELLELETDLQQFRQSAKVLRQHVDRMSRTLREMVDFSRRRRDQSADVSVSAVIDDALKLIRHDPRWKKVQTDSRVPGTLPSVRIVEDHLLLVVLNLLINAADAMPEGGLVRISATHDEFELRVLIEDSGSGMSPEVLRQAMHPMFTTKAPGRGTGLGLTVSLDVLRHAGGNLTLQSEVGKGTRAILTLPVSATGAASSSCTPDSPQGLFA